jgi:hypothetical protein
MGNRGEKQKKKPKFTDKKQSERFKETAREVGADEGTTKDAERVLDQMLGVNHPTSEPSEKPTTLLAVNSGGIAKLADGTFWRLALDGGRAGGWIGAQVIVREERLPNPAWRLALVNLDINDMVAVVAAGVGF